MFEKLAKWALDYPLYAVGMISLISFLYRIGCALHKRFFARCAVCGKSPDYAVKTPEGKQHYCAECFEYRRGYFEWLEENQENCSYSELDGEEEEDEEEDEEDEEEREEEEEDGDDR